MADDPRNIFVNQRNGYNGSNDTSKNPNRATQSNGNNGFSFGENTSNFANGQSGNASNNGKSVNGHNYSNGNQNSSSGNSANNWQNQRNSQNFANGSTNQNMENNADYQQKVTEMKRLAEKYQREGEGQLVKDIVNNVIEQKARGQLTNDQLITFAKRVRPLLNADQRQRLDALVEQLLKL